MGVALKLLMHFYLQLLFNSREKDLEKHKYLPTRFDFHAALLPLYNTTARQPLQDRVKENNEEIKFFSVSNSQEYKSVRDFLTNIFIATCFTLSQTCIL